MSKEDLYLLLEKDTNGNLIKSILSKYINTSYHLKTKHDSKGEVLYAIYTLAHKSTAFKKSTDTKRQMIYVTVNYPEVNCIELYKLSVCNIKKYIRRNLHYGRNFIDLLK